MERHLRDGPFTRAFAGSAVWLALRLDRGDFSHVISWPRPRRPRFPYGGRFQIHMAQPMDECRAATDLVEGYIWHGRRSLRLAAAEQRSPSKKSED